MRHLLVQLRSRNGVGHKDPHLNFRAKFIVPPAAGFIYCERLQNLEFRLHWRKTRAEDHISKKGKILFFRLQVDIGQRKNQLPFSYMGGLFSPPPPNLTYDISKLSLYKTKCHDDTSIPLS